MVNLSDPIGDLLTRLRNAQKVGHATCKAPHSSVKMDILQTMKRDGWIEEVSEIGAIPTKELEVTFIKEKPRMDLKRVSKPGRRIYKHFSELKPVLNGFGVAILSTSQGVMTDKEARAKKIGGEVLCTVS
jgi:small subunit ribosomal protein S8